MMSFPHNKRSKKLTVVVATLTRERPKMLANLLHSLANLEAPDNCIVRFLIVENNTSNSEEEAVQAVRPTFAFGTVHYTLEKELGIASARNAAAKEAIRFNSDILVFVDDDETVPKEWLKNLVNGYREQGNRVWNSWTTLLGNSCKFAVQNDERRRFVH